ARTVSAPISTFTSTSTTRAAPCMVISSSMWNPESIGTALSDANVISGNLSTWSTSVRMAAVTLRISSVSGGVRTSRLSAGTVIGLDDQLEREEGATGALGLNERGERHHEVGRWLEAQAVAVGQRAAVAAVTAQQLEHLVAPLAELGSRECAGDRRLRRGRPRAHAASAPAVAIRRGVRTASTAAVRSRAATSPQRCPIWLGSVMEWYAITPA